MRQHVALVVDDEPSLRLLLDEVLGEEGYEVHAVSTVAEAVDLLDGGLLPCTAIVDQRLPDLPGSSLIEWMRDDPRFVHSGIVAISAQHTLLEGLGSLHVEIVAKPFVLEGLLAAVRRACRSSELPPAAFRSSLAPGWATR